jgi:hypothetical protein
MMRQTLTIARARPEVAKGLGGEPGLKTLEKAVEQVRKELEATRGFRFLDAEQIHNAYGDEYLKRILR